MKNLSDGNVEACVTCEESQLNHFIDILKQGSPYSNVTNIEQSEHNEIFTNKFEVQ